MEFYINAYKHVNDGSLPVIATPRTEKTNPTNGGKYVHETRQALERATRGRAIRPPGSVS
jgi:hypothetical protein